MDADLRICPMAEADLDELVRLHELYLNYGEGIRTHFEGVLRDPASVAVKCEAGGRMVGLDIYTCGVALSGGHEALCNRVRALAGGARSGVQLAGNKDVHIFGGVTGGQPEAADFF